jgi:energy-coupling factor transporter transmembrane protein EcfT
MRAFCWQISFSFYVERRFLKRLIYLSRFAVEKIRSQCQTNWRTYFLLFYFLHFTFYFLLFTFYFLLFYFLAAKIQKEIKWNFYQMRSLHLWYFSFSQRESGCHNADFVYPNYHRDSVIPKLKKNLNKPRLANFKPLNNIGVNETFQLSLQTLFLI